MMVIAAELFPSHFGKGTIGSKRIIVQSIGKEELQKSMDRCSGCQDIAEIRVMQKPVLNNIQSINRVGH